MQTTRKDIELLWNKLLHNEASKTELDTLLQYVQDIDALHPDWSFIQEGIAREQPTEAGYVDMDADQRAGLRERILAITSGEKPTIVETGVKSSTGIIHQLKRRWLAAASVILIIGYGIYLFQDKNTNTATPQTVVHTNDIEPGKPGAILTLGDGRTLILDSIGNGVIASQNGAQVVVKNGQLAYDIAGHTTGDVVYNTVSTPKGRKFNMLLPDGTEVWLNAASSIRYPTVFTGWERTVTITGEVYFNVAKNKTTPFRVNVNQRETIDVLGTSFNVNAYENELSIHTTLLDGSIRVQAGTGPLAGNLVLLKPGQQAQLPNIGMAASNGASPTINVVDAVVVDKIIAWKNDYFNLDDVQVADLMRQVERWYDVEVIYEKGVPDKRFFGKVNRGISLLDFMEGLKDWGVAFKLEGNKLIISK